MRPRPIFALLLGSAVLLGAPACDSGPSPELEAARADLEAARADLERTQALLVAATEQLTETREAMEARRSTLSQPPPPRYDSENTVGSAASETSEAMREKAASAIQCATESLCTIDRAFVDEVLGSPQAFGRQARVVPSIRDEVTEGFKLYAIRPGSIPDLLGLKNGDLITSVNDEPLSDMNTAMGLYAKLRDSDTFVLEIKREDKAMSLTVKLRGGAPATPR